MSFNKNIGVLGAGSWGTALVKMLSENCDKILSNVIANQEVHKKYGVINQKLLQKLLCG